jgi:hypothetical protein
MDQLPRTLSRGQAFDVLSSQVNCCTPATYAHALQCSSSLWRLLALLLVMSSVLMPQQQQLS